MAAYVVRCSCDPPPNGDGGQTVVDHIRLFPVREGVRWSYAVHEQILPTLRVWKLVLEACPDDAEAMAREQAAR